MNQQPDNFFREKLSGYGKPAPEGAWDRVATALDKSDKSFGWWKVAASLLLLAAIGYVLWPPHDASVEQPVAQAEKQNVQPLQESNRVEINPPQEIITQPRANESSASTIEKISRETDKPKKIRKKEKPAQALENRSPVAVVESQPATESPLPEIVAQEVAPNPLPVEKGSALTLTFTVEETNQYLNKNAVVQATTEEKKSSTFKKLLKKANDLKSNQDPFGDLREKKNEILALNFKNDRRGQNK